MSFMPSQFLTPFLHAEREGERATRAVQQFVTDRQVDKGLTKVRHILSAVRSAAVCLDDEAQVTPLTDEQKRQAIDALLQELFGERVVPLLEKVTA